MVLLLSSYIHLRLVGVGDIGVNYGNQYGTRVRKRELKMIRGLLEQVFPKRKAKREIRELAQPVTRADLDRLRVELKETPEEKEELEIYNKWMSMSPKERKEKWIYLSIKQRNRLGRIVSERMTIKAVKK